MRRVHRSFDLLEAHIIAGLLRDDGVNAEVFDADFVRQDWFKMLAYGGFRIVVPDAEFAEATERIKQYQAGVLASEGDERARCPSCGNHSGHDDPQPRRNVFLAMILLSVIEVPLLIASKPSAVDILAAFGVQVGLCVSLPWLIVRYFKWRVRCDTCGHRWRAAPRHRYAELAQAVEAAERA